MKLSTVTETVTGLKEAGRGVNIIYFDFGGYYYSLWDGQLDMLIEREREYLVDEYGVTEDEVVDLVDESIDRSATREAMNKAILFGLGYATGGRLSPGYIEMISPRFYNYETDVMRVALSADEIEEMDAILEEEDLLDEFEANLESVTTAKSGYAPYYSKETIPTSAIERIKLNTIYKHFEDQVVDYVSGNTSLEYKANNPIDKLWQAKQEEA